MVAVPPNVTVDCSDLTVRCVAATCVSPACDGAFLREAAGRAGLTISQAPHVRNLAMTMPFDSGRLAAVSVQRRHSVCGISRGRVRKTSLSRTDVPTVIALGRHARA